MTIRGLRPRRGRLLAAGVALGALALAGAPAADADAAPHKPLRLTLLHNNDGESKLADGSSVPGYGGAARFKTVVDRLRAEADAAEVPSGTAKGTVTLSSGDNFLASLALLTGFESGPPWPDAKAINLIGYDALTLGNHEFDFGPGRLAEFISGVEAPAKFLSANLGFFPEPALRRLAFRGRLAPTTVIERDGERIGVIGLTTPDISGISAPGKVRIRNDLARIVNTRAALLALRGVNKVVVSAHLQGIAADEALIPRVRGVDVWIAGGGDDLLADPDDTLVPGETSVGSYPKPVADARGRDVLVVSTAGEYKYVGRLTVDFDRRGTVTAVDGARSGPVRVSATATDPDFAPADPEVVAQAVDPVTAFSANLAAQPVGSTEGPLLRTLPGSPANDPIRRRESGFGSVVADSYLWAGQQQAASVGVDAPQAAIANGGGIRADIAAGPIDRADTFGTLPFFNQVAVVEDVACEPLRQLLERGYADLPAISGGFANLAGLRVEVDPAQQAQIITAAPAPVEIVTPGQRVRNLWLTNGTPQDTADDTPLIADGQAVADCPTTDLATVNFTAADGDRYPFTAQDLTFTVVPSLYNEAFEDYIAAPVTEGGLGGTITLAQYPVTPAPGSVRRITIAGD